MDKGNGAQVALTPQERCDLLAKTRSRKFLEGTELPPFPEVVDNTMRASYRKCPIGFFKEHLLCRVMGADNIHLVAGGAFAEGNDAFRKSYFTRDTPVYRDYDAALDAGLYALIKHYGYDEQRESREDWATSPKSCERLIDAFLDYWKEYHPRASLGKQYYHDGEVASELGGILELDVCHPVTGKPLLYSFRFDYIEERNGAIWLGDDKTTTSLGASWAKQWDLRSQFMGYLYAAKVQLGIQATGVIARGTGILKTKITHMEVPVRFPPHLLDLWWKQVNRDFQHIVDNYRECDWEYDLADGCNAYGGCKFVDTCRSKLPHRMLDSMPIRVWNPADPENSPVKYVEDL